MVLMNMVLGKRSNEGLEEPVLGSLEKRALAIFDSNTHILRGTDDDMNYLTLSLDLAHINDIPQ